jgi:mono/diheme cytochrome c family protein
MTPAAVRFALVLAVARGGAACRTEETLIAPDPHLQRMVRQEKVLPYAEEPLLPRNMSMQAPPEGTMPADVDPTGLLLQGPYEPLDGVAGGRYVPRIPIRVDRPLVDDGRRHFDTLCAPCHGTLGDGVSAVAEKMALRKPPSLLVEPIRDYPPGRVYEAIRSGYGLMPSYAIALSARDAWGVVAYVRALELARRAPVARLPADVRAALSKEAR